MMKGNQAHGSEDPSTAAKVAGALVVSGAVWAFKKGVEKTEQASTGTVRNAGSSLVASLRDYLDPALQNSTSYNERLDIFCKACSSAAQLRFRPERRQAFRDLAASAADIGTNIRRLHLNGHEKPNLNSIRESIDELEKAIGQL